MLGRSYYGRYMTNLGDKMETKTLIAVAIVIFFLYMQVEENIFPYLLPRSYCEPGTHPDPDNEKLCIPDIYEEPGYFPMLKEFIFMGILFIALTFIFTRKN